jgi:sugar lactone lactonase YvrE
MSALDGEIIDKVVNGQKTNNFEEMHLLTPGIAWSPDGKRLALAVKAGEHDAIFLVDVKSGKQEKIQLDLDGVFSVNWSNDGNLLSFVGVKSPQSDIYIYNITTKEVKNLTNDIFSDSDPVFSPDSKTIYFASDRGDMTSPYMISKNFKIWKYDFGQTDLFAVDISTGVIRRITTQPNGSKTSPVISPDGTKILFVADMNGINNIYAQELVSGKCYPITNSISGLYQLSLSHDGSKLVFASLNEAGFDIYLMLRPLERKLNVAVLEPTEFYKMKYNLPREEKPKEVVGLAPSSDTIAVRSGIVVVADTAGMEPTYQSRVKADLSNYVFSPEVVHDTVNAVPPISQVELTDNQDVDSNYIPRRYKLNFSPDLIYGAANYNTFYGIEGSTVLAFSDMLGDHQIIFQTNLLIDLKNSDYGISYLYLPGRIDWGFQAFHNAKFLSVSDPVYLYRDYRFSTWGVGALASYPLDRFNRIDLSLMWLNLSRDDLTDPTNPSQIRSFALPWISYANDNSLWQGEWFGPNNGSRFNFTFYGTPKIGSDGLDIQTFTADYRRYSKLAKEFIFAYRLSGGISTGTNKQNFLLGGTEGWINYHLATSEIPIFNVEDFAFLTQVLPLRGYDYAQQIGTRFAVANMELRFPLLKYLIFGALPIGFANILGSAFVDMGSAWSDDPSWRAFDKDPNDGSTITKDLLIGTGVGTRLFIFGLPIRFDIAWRFRITSFSEPFYYFAIGPDF